MQSDMLKLCFFLLINLSLVVRNLHFAYVKNKDADQLHSKSVTAQLNIDIGFATRIEQSLYFLDTKFHVSSHLLWLYSLVCVRLVGNPQDRFSHTEAHFVILLLIFLQYVLQFVKQLIKSIIEDVFI